MCRGRVGQREDDDVVAVGRLPHELPRVGGNHPDARIGEVLRQEAAAGFDDERVEFHAVHPGDIVFEDFIRHPGDDA